jgi:hypothetical protein
MRWEYAGLLHDSFGSISKPLFTLPAVSLGGSLRWSRFRLLRGYTYTFRIVFPPGISQGTKSLGLIESQKLLPVLAP